MARVGEASGRIADVLKEAAEQMAYEDRLRKDFSNAMTYPAFLGFAGMSAVGFIFTQVVPRFATMIGEDRSNVPAMSSWVLSAGEFANANLGVVGIGNRGRDGPDRRHCRQPDGPSASLYDRARHARRRSPSSRRAKSRPGRG